MKFQQQVQLLGLKRSRGTLDNGTAFDSTKAFLVLPMDSSKGDAVGASCDAFNIGTSLEFDKWKGVKLPCVCMADMEVVTNGTTTKIVVRELHPAKA